MSGLTCFLAICSLLPVIQGSLYNEEDETAKKGCPPLSIGSVRISCDDADGQADCRTPQIGYKARMVWRKNIIKKYKGVNELVCKAGGVWKKGTVKSDRKPPVGYETIPGVGSYKMYTKALPWYEASYQCRGDGAELIVFDSIAEVEAVKELIQRSIKPGVNEILSHYGVTDRELEGAYVTAHGAPLSLQNDDGVFIQWKPGQPDNWTDDDCLVLTNQYKLADELCTKENAFICEMLP